jgi:hypothetical protein
VASGRGRGGIRRRSWLHRTEDHVPEPSAAGPEVAGADSDAGEPVGAGGSGEPGAQDTQASLDQVLRKADVARRAEREPEG